MLPDGKYPKKTDTSWYFEKSKPSINGQFSMAMLVITRWYILVLLNDKKNMGESSIHI